MGRPHKQLEGLQFGYLKVLEFAGVDSNQKALWKTRCVCGKIRVQQAQNFCRPKYQNQSCGCMRYKTIAAAVRTHGMTNHPAYAVWRSMCDRCRLPTHQAWHNYGARGIKVCAVWNNSFMAFWNDMGGAYRPGLTLDRRDNNGDYNRTNCRWTTRRVQCNNKRNNTHIETPWGLCTVSEASRLSGVGVTCLLYRIAHKVPQARLFDKPNFRNRFPR